MYNNYGQDIIVYMCNTKHYIYIKVDKTLIREHARPRS